MIISNRYRPALATALSLALSCGAGDAEAPVYDPGPGDCPSLTEMMPVFNRLVEQGRLDGLRHVLANEIDPEVDLPPVLDGVLRLVRQLSADEFTAVLRLTENPHFSELGPLLADLIDFLNTYPNLPATLDQLRFTMQTCRGGPLFEALDALFDAPELPRLLQSIGEALKLPPVQQLLHSDTEISLERPGFTALVCNMLAGMTRPGFSVVDDVIGPISRLGLIDPNSPPISHILTDLGTLLGPQSAVVPPVTDVLCCDLYGRSTCAEVPLDAPTLGRDPVMVWLMYDMFVAEALPIERVLEIAGGISADPNIRATLAPLRTVLRQFAHDEDLRDALVRMTLILLEEENVRLVLPDVSTLIREEALDELMAVVRAIWKGCEMQDVTP